MANLIGITRKIPETGVDYLLSKGFKLKQWPSDVPPNQKELESFLSDCEGAITLLSDQLNSELLSKLQNLKILCNFAVGYNNIDINYCAEHNVKVTNTPDVLTEATAELTLALLLTVARKIIPAYLNVYNAEWKTWNPTGFIGLGLKGKTLGIIGPGRIAFEFAKKCHFAFDMNIIYYGRGPKENFDKQLNAKNVSIEEVLSQSDVVSLHCALTEETRYLIAKKELDLMKNNSILLNTARGEIINQKDLEQKIKENSLFGVGLDVTTPEPIDMDSPLLKNDKVVIIPHIGSANKEARDAMSLLCAQNIAAYFSDRPLLTEVTAT